jgi:hypothetical protein
MPSVRKRRYLLGLAWFLLGSFFSLSTASAADIPNLSWARGREQSITLGGNTQDQYWAISLAGPEGKELQLSKSSPNESGFFVYRAFIPLDYPVGTYDVKVKSPTQESTVAHVKIELAQNYDPLTDPRAVGGLAVLAFTLLTALTSPSQDQQDESNNDAQNLDSLESGNQGIKIGRRGRIDLLRLGKSQVIFTLDEYRHNIVYELSSRSSLLRRLFADGSYLQAILGPIGILTPFVGVILGWLCGTHSDTASNVIPVGAGYVVSILLLGFFDALAGFLAALTYGIFLLTHGDFTSVFQVRGFLGLLVMWCGPILAANKLRPLRRSIGQNYRWERTGDLIIPALFIGFGVKGMLLALNGFTHQHNQITQLSGKIALISGAAILLRYVLEECASRLSPARLEYLSPPNAPEIQLRFKILALVTKVFLYLFFMFGFLGWTWQLAACLSLLLFPPIFKIAFPTPPNSTKLFQLLPAGIPGIIFMNLLGLVAINWINSLPLFAPDKTQTIFVLAALPGFVIGLIGLFGRSPNLGDRRWYLRDKNRVLYRFLGPIFLAVAALITFGVLP